MEPENQKLNVLIVDDHPLYRKAIKGLLANIDFIKKSEEAENGQYSAGYDGVGGI